jgi:p-methyltransferase
MSDCLIISYSEPSRGRERQQFFNGQSKTGNGWGRFLHLNYIDYEGDIMLPNHLASIAKLTREQGAVRRTPEGHFYESDIATYSAWKIPLLGGIYLYQYLKQLDFHVEIVQHAQLEAEKLEQCLDRGPKVIAISTTLLLNPLDIADLVRYCRKRCPDAFIVLGGMSIWNAYQDKKDPAAFKSYRADACVIDPRGFRTLGKLVAAVCNGKSLDDVPNLFLYRKTGAVATTMQPETYDFLDNAIKYDLIDQDLMGRISLVRTQISCPFACSFCSYPTSQGDVLKSPLEAVEAELNALRARGVTHLLFVDDTFNVPPSRFKEMLQLLKQYEFSWYAFIRCQYLDKQQVVDMRESGCRGAYLGIESGNDAILKGMNKRVTSAQYLRGVELLRSQGISTLASFIVGFPGETEDTLRDTIQFIDRSGTEFFNVKIFYYDHTTPIHQQAAAYDLTGQGMTWAHRTMNSTQAFAYTEDVIKSVRRAPYIAQHSGEIWEVAFFHERGFSPSQLQTLYGNFTRMIGEELSSNGASAPLKQKLFHELTAFC